jgi:hypothetical protein
LLSPSDFNLFKKFSNEKQQSKKPQKNSGSSSPPQKLYSQPLKKKAESAKRNLAPEKASKVSKTQCHTQFKTNSQKNKQNTKSTKNCWGLFRKLTK